MAVRAVGVAHRHPLCLRAFPHPVRGRAAPPCVPLLHRGRLRRSGGTSRRSTRVRPHLGRT
eukprot:66931-Prorocentrum_lima.AAC.1